MSIAYQQAANVIQQFWDKKASLKTLIYGSSFPKKGYLFALCTKTLEAQPVIDDIITNCPSLLRQEISKKALLYVILYDEFFGEGCRGGGALIRTVRGSKPEILSYLNARMKETGVSSFKALLPQQALVENWRFLRVNRCKTTVDKVLRILRQEYGDESIQRDELIDCVLRIRHSIDLHSHPLVLSQSIILQTKASCIPPFLLLRDLYDGTKHLSERCDVIDATAAPGNKTTFLGDILRNQGTVFALDRDEKRFRVLRSRCKEYGSGNIHCIHSDFLQTNPYASEFIHVQRILLDPSCSGSGMSHTSLDASPPSQERLQSLTRFQLRCILHAAQFPSVTRISYSTCSVYEEEDEKVVAEALNQLNKDKEIWHVERVCEEVSCRGHVVDGLTSEQAECVIRCEVGDGMGQGFFVCVFVRDSGISLSEAERKKKEKEYTKSLTAPEAPIAPTEQKKVIVEKKRKENQMVVEKKQKENPKTSSEKKGVKEKKTQQDKTVPINYALRAQQEHPGRHRKKIPIGKSH